MSESSQQRPAAPPLPPITEIDLIEELRNALSVALENGTPVLVAYVDNDGQPSLSYRGSVQAFSKDQIALWARNPEGGLQSALASNPRISAMYRDPATRLVLNMKGRARIDGDESVRNQVYEDSPKPEQAADPDRKGLAIIVDLDQVDGGSPAGRFRMRRGGA